MNRITILLASAALTVSAVASERLPAGGGEWTEPLPQDHITAEKRSEIRSMIRRNIDQLTRAGKLPEERAGGVLFDWPLAASNSLGDNGFHGISNFVDQDATFPNALLDYSCGARSYDLSSGYNHRGIDFFTWPFGWKKMDADQVNVVAAADGTIVARSDGNFDRNCGFNSSNWNAVFVRHADGSIAWYGHLKSGSVTPKSVGDSVVSGEVLGVVGSSGSSTGPHLHFEVYDNNDNLIEPYAGICNSLNIDSWWANQRDYYDSAVNAMRTGFAPPAFQTCPTPTITNTRSTFIPGEIIYMSIYYRDQLDTQTTNYRLRRPDGSVVLQWNHFSNAPHYAASYWYWTANLIGQPLGTYTFEADYEGETHTQQFELIAASLDSDGDAVFDHEDNCIARPNPAQQDSNGDGYGNACDADLNNDGVINFIDISAFAATFLTTDADADFNSDGVVNFLDLLVVQTMFLSPPGPSAYAP
ncbi:MAG: peptidoglycan DD-metalloendopeptidase family protein [Gammaproteobacteria bacterium]